MSNDNNVFDNQNEIETETNPVNIESNVPQESTITDVMNPITEEKVIGSFQPTVPEYSDRFQKIYDEWKKDELSKNISHLFFVPIISFFVLSVFGSIVIVPMLSFDTTQQEIIFNIIFSLVMYILPIIIASTIFQKNIFSSFITNPKVPKKPILTIIFVLGMGFLVPVIFEPITSLIPSIPMSDDYFSNTQNLLLTFVSIAVVPAIFEEWLFRGLLLKHLLPLNKTAAIIVSGIMFGMMHPHPTQAVFASVIGILFGVVYVNSGCNIWLTIIIHFLNNAYAVFEGYIISKYPETSWQFWLTEFPGYVFMIIAVGILFYYVLLQKKAFFTLDKTDEVEIYEPKPVIKKVVTSPLFYVAVALMLFNQIAAIITSILMTMLPEIT